MSAFGDRDVVVRSTLGVAVRPVFHTPGAQDWSDVEDPMAFYVDAVATPTHVDAALAPG